MGRCSGGPPLHRRGPQGDAQGQGEVVLGITPIALYFCILCWDYDMLKAYAMTFAMMYECDLASGCAKKLFSSMLVFDEANNRVGQRGLVSAPHCYDSLGCVLLISTFPSDPSPRGCNLHMINIACLDKSAVGPTSSQGSELYNKYRQSIKAKSWSQKYLK